MKNKKIIGILIITFLAGTISSSLISTAHGVTPDPLLSIVNAIKDLTTTIQNKNTSVNVSIPQNQTESRLALTVTATNTGEIFSQSNQVLFYGSTLCRIGVGGSTSMFIQFATDTLVQNINVACGNSYGGNLIALSGGSDATFHKGDRLILERISGPNWTEVTRETS